MPRPRAAMRKIREALRLCLAEGLSPRQTGMATGLPRTTVRRYVERAAEVGLGWPLPPEIDDRALEERLFGRAAPPPAVVARPVPTGPIVHRELRRKSVTLALLWTEYRAALPRRLRVHLVHRAVPRPSRAGSTSSCARITAPARSCSSTSPGRPSRSSTRHRRDQPGPALRGRPRRVELHVRRGAALPGRAAHWTAAHVRAFEFMGGVPAILVPDNLKAGVIKPHRYEPILNRTYAELAAHYGCADPAGSAREAKGQGEGGIRCSVAERWISAALRNRTFFSLAEANAAIRERVDLAEQPARSRSSPAPGRACSRQLDRPALRPLPGDPVRVRDLEARAKVSIDYHVEVDRHYYSVPVPARAVSGRRPGIGAHGRDLRPGPAGGEPLCAAERRGQAHDDRRAHARVPSPPSRVDARAPDRLGRADRTADRTPWWPRSWRRRPHPEQGYPLVPRDLPPRASPRTRAPGGRLRPGSRGRRPHLSQRRLDPAGRPRRAAPAGARAGASHPGSHANVRGPGYYE